jgi:hypothetical protein
MFHRPLTAYSLDKLAIMASLGTLILGCAAMEPATSLPEGAIQMDAPLSYQAWWNKTESCAQLTGRMDQVTWYVVPGVSTFQTESGEKVGFWTKSPGGTSIILAGDYRDHELVVRHEILHELLGRDGHPETYFRNRCQLTWDTFEAPAIALH